MASQDTMFVVANKAILGIDLGGTQVRVGKVRAGTLEHHEARRISGQEAQGVVLAEIFQAIDEVFDDSVVGIGCGVPSLVDVERGVVYAVENIPSWREVPLKEELERRYGVPAYINNDANAFAVGEQHALDRLEVACSEIEHVAILGAAALYLDARGQNPSP